MIEYQGVKAVLFDIEGTVSDIQFVKNTLFPYSREHMSGYLEAHYEENQVQEALQLLKQTADEEGLVAETREQQVELLKAWIDEDRKHPALKSLQGMIWKKGFEDKTYEAPLYEDVLPFFKNLREKGRRMSIYSSGSRGAQLLFFTFTQHGDLKEYFDDFYDLQMGSKKDEASYKTILQAWGVSAEQTLFFSDVPAELHAAHRAGLQVGHVVRPGTEPSHEFPTLSSFAEVSVLGFS